MTEKYIRFVEMEQTPARATKVLMVVSIHHNDALGEIRWHGPWRQYCFFPDLDTVWSRGCMQEVQDKIQELMSARRAES